MSDNIIKSKMLIGRDTIQVKELLGNPSWRDSSNVHWYYDMGEGGGGLGFLFHNLSINFDNNKVVKIEHQYTKD